VLDILDRKPDNMELVLTGRNAPQELIDRADLVTEMLLVKHPYNKGIAARKGIEY
jgi:cob(I)alamin adenosyltransferase